MSHIRSVGQVNARWVSAGYYQPFIKSFTVQASEQDNSFKDLKYALTHAPVLIFSSFRDPFPIYTDASTVGIGAVLMQTDGARKNNVIAFGSHVQATPD